jgi:hypothetical protein
MEISLVARTKEEIGGGMRMGGGNNEFRREEFNRPNNQFNRPIMRNRGRQSNPIGTMFVGVVFAGIGYLFTKQSTLGWAFVGIGVLIIIAGIFSMRKGPQMGGGMMPQQAPMSPPAAPPMQGGGTTPPI